MAKAVRFIEVKAPVYMPDIIRVIRDRYQFVKFPVSADEIIPPQIDTTPVTFLHGKWEHQGRTIIVSGIELYPQFVAVNTALSTDDSDIVIEDLLGLSDAVVAGPLQPKGYVSQLEVVLQGTSLDYVTSTLGALATALSERISQYIPNVVSSMQFPFHVAGFVIRHDPLRPMPVALAADFRIERRLSRAYDENVYFTQAPLGTFDHVEVLREFEEALRIRRDVAVSPIEPPPPSGQSGSAS